MKYYKSVALVAASVQFALVILAVAVSGYHIEPNKTNAANGDGCPTGSYNIGISKDGQPLCKLEPTGCPYGDSIPLDSPKCVPPPVQKPAPKPSPKQPPKVKPAPKPTRNCEE
jgi:hypothetical protein